MSLQSVAIALLCLHGSQGAGPPHTGADSSLASRSDRQLQAIAGVDSLVTEGRSSKSASWRTVPCKLREPKTKGLYPDATAALEDLGLQDRVTRTLDSAHSNYHGRDSGEPGEDVTAAVDLSTSCLTDEQIRDVLRALSSKGFAAWFRKPGTDGWRGSAHIHAIWVGASLKKSLERQVRAWFAHRNGLVSDGSYEFWSPSNAEASAVLERLDDKRAAPLDARDLTWQPVGSAPTTQGQVENITNGEVVGAIQALAPHPQDPQILYVGAVNGGIWKTQNAEAPRPRWVQLLDDSTPLSIGALEFDPTDHSHQTLVAGFGNFSSFYHVGGDLEGIVRTTDGGKTWSSARPPIAMGALNVTSLVARRNFVLVGTSEQGVIRVDISTNDWRSDWGERTKQLPHESVFDMVGDPENESIIYAVVRSNGVYRSYDGGQSWSNVSTPELAQSASTATNARLASGMSGRIFVAIEGTGNVLNVLRSVDHGMSWAALDIPSILEADGRRYGLNPGDQGDVNLSIATDPNHIDMVYIGGDRQPSANDFAAQREKLTAIWPNALGAQRYSGRLFRIDSHAPRGKQITTLTHVGTRGNSAPHADSRRMRVDAAGALLEADDGGVYKRSRPSDSMGDWSSLNGNLQISEFHSIAWDSNAHVLIAGAQDTGAPEQMQRDALVWQTIEEGDGGFVAVDSTSLPGKSVRYTSSWDLWNFERQTYDADGEFIEATTIDPVLRNTNERIAPQFYTPVVVNAVDQARVLIAGDNGLYESLDRVDTVSLIDASLEDIPTDANMIAYGGGSNPDALYVAYGAHIKVRRQAGLPLTLLGSYPGDSPINAICMDTSDPSIVYAIDIGHVYRGLSFGASWSDISGSLLTQSPGDLHSCAFIKTPRYTGLAVGSSRGVFTLSDKKDAQWVRLGRALPKVLVSCLEYDKRDGVLVAGTLGRGAWMLRPDSLADGDIVVAPAASRTFYRSGVVR